MKSRFWKIAFIVVAAITLTEWFMREPPPTLSFVNIRVEEKWNVPGGVRCAVFIMENPGTSPVTYFADQFWPCTYIREVDAPIRPQRASAYPKLLRQNVIAPGERIEIRVPLYYDDAPAPVSKPCRIGVHIERDAQGTLRDFVHWLDDVGIELNLDRDSIVWSEVLTP